MGVWSTSLYGGDYALDLRGTIAAIARLPFAAEELLAIVKSIDQKSANDPSDDDYSTFWLVVADQFTRRGIASSEATEKAMAIIDDGSDLAALAALGMKPADLTKRAKALADLRGTLAAKVRAARRAVLKKPQPFLLELGDVYAYPTSSGTCINPYYPAKELVPGWSHDGYGAMTIVDRGRAFEFLAWYTPVVVLKAVDELPADRDLLRGWRLGYPGTCSAIQLKRIEPELIGHVDVDRRKAESVLSLPSGRDAAIGGAFLDLDCVAHRRVATNPDATPVEAALARLKQSSNDGRHRHLADRPRVDRLDDLSI